MTKKSKKPPAEPEHTDGAAAAVAEQPGAADGVQETHAAPAAQDPQPTDGADAGDEHQAVPTRSLVSVLEEIIGLAPELREHLQPVLTSAGYAAPENSQLVWRRAAAVLEEHASNHPLRAEIAAAFAGKPYTTPRAQVIGAPAQELRLSYIPPTMFLSSSVPHLLDEIGTLEGELIAKIEHRTQKSPMPHGMHAPHARLVAEVAVLRAVVAALVNAAATDKDLLSIELHAALAREVAVG